MIHRRQALEIEQQPHARQDLEVGGVGLRTAYRALCDQRVGEVERTSTRPTIAAVSRRLTLGVRLVPGLYRITVRAYTDKQKLSHRARRWVRVLG